MAENPVTDDPGKASWLIDSVKKKSSYLWIIAAAIVIMRVIFSSMTSLDAGQVAVRINNLSGKSDVITQPGLIMKLPFGVHSIYVLDISPQTFHMRGTANKSPLEGRELEVRASDGSSFAFNDTTLLFRAIPGSAPDILRDSGLKHSYYEWLLPYGRAILRDEFGRESTISVSNPTSFAQAETRAKTRLNKLLANHGIEVTSIVTPRPRFSTDYEHLIESRNQTENQLAVIDSDLARAKTERSRKLAEVERDQNKVIQTKRAALENSLATAVSELAQTRREVDAYKIEKLGSGQAARSAAKATSEQLKGKLDAELSSKRAEINAFKDQPVERVMERLGERLKGVTIEIQPYRHDGSPQRVQVETIGVVK